ncbi:MAG: M48 family metalloprotease [Gammaproteobacteria bacterium]|nr:M48 family metalloprotease [Gammaproteobacteria bacterium]
MWFRIPVYNAQMTKYRLPLLILSLCLICTTNTSIAKEVDLPDIGDSGAALLTPAQERRVGEAVMHNLRRAGMIVDDPIATAYLNQLGYRLLAQRENPDQTKFTFFLVNDKSINAFALPGGFIGINYGLVMETDSEDELAAVLAHEISHVTQRHYARAYGASSSSELPVIAAIIAAIVLGAHGNADIGQAAIATAAGASAQHQITFTRHNEEEADRIGIQLLAKAGFDPEMMAEFFEKLDKESRLYGSNIPAFLLDHPVNSERITDARNRADQLPRPKPHDELMYLLMRDRIIAESGSDKEATVKKFQIKINNTQGEQQIAARYGYVLSLIRAENYAEARNQIDILLQHDPQRIAFLLVKAEIDLRSGKIPTAIKTYEKALQIYPANSALTYDYANALLQERQYQKAETVLNTFLKVPTDNPNFYQLLARATTKTGKPADAHEALAEYYYQIGQLHQAIDQINLALKTKNLDFYTNARLEAQLARIKEEVPKEGK